MFSGIIEETGKILAIQPTHQGGFRMRIHSGKLARRLKPADSIAVDGICLTVTRKNGSGLSIDVSPETWRKTNLMDKKTGDLVNLELPVTVSTMLSGHFVQGHVEGIARVEAWKREGDDVRLVLRLTPDLVENCVSKGSIAVNGVSLTIAGLKRRKMEIALIPYTLRKTNLERLQPGDHVNIETDIIGRYVVSALKRQYDGQKSKNLIL